MHVFTLLVCQDLAIEKKGKCLAFFYKRRMPVKWECKNGHIFILPVDKVKKGEWCRICKNNAFKRMLTAYLIYNNIINWN